jgi:hypothetical protein
MLRRFLLACLAGLALCANAQTINPFQPQDGVSTTSLAVTGTAQNITLPVGSPAGAYRQLVFTAVGTVTIFYRCDGVTATVANSMPMLANSQFIVTIPGSVLTCSVIAGGVGTTLYATSGFGV